MFLILKNKKPWFISSSILRQTAISIKRGKVNENELEEDEVETLGNFSCID